MGRGREKRREGGEEGVFFFALAFTDMGGQKGEKV